MYFFKHLNVTYAIFGMYKWDKYKVACASIFQGHPNVFKIYKLYMY